jgi:polyphosphate kinase 2 (PPK2 family)
VKPFCKSKKRYEKILAAHVKELSALQQLHYASNRHALLLIFQGMDAAGKDGAIRHVMSSGTNPTVWPNKSARRLKRSISVSKYFWTHFWTD